MKTKKIDPNILEEKFIIQLKRAVADFSKEYQRNYGATVPDDILMSFLTKEIDNLEEASQEYLTITDKSYILTTVFDSLRGLNILQALIDDKTVTEIMINGPYNIFIEKDGKIIRSDVVFKDHNVLGYVIQNIVAPINRRVNEAEPIVDARLKDGSRVNIVLPPIGLDGAVVTIRKFPEKPITIEKLVEFKSLTKEVANILDILVKAKFNIFVCGGTGSGKTTFLNALSNFIPSDERVITIEDSAELQIQNVQNLVRLETRNKNSKGEGEVSITDLIRSSLRMRPERIVVGEIRGKEALDMLQAMNTGHDGSLSTGHANSNKDMLSRIEVMVLQGSAEAPLESIRAQISSALDIIIHLSRLRDKSRRTMEISEIVDYVDNQIILNPIYKFVETGEDENGKIIGGLVRTENEFVNKEKLLAAGYKIEI